MTAKGPACTASGAAISLVTAADSAVPVPVPVPALAAPLTWPRRAWLPRA